MSNLRRYGATVSSSLQNSLKVQRGAVPHILSRFKEVHPRLKYRAKRRKTRQQPDFTFDDILLGAADSNKVFYLLNSLKSDRISIA